MSGAGNSRSGGWPVAAASSLATMAIEFEKKHTDREAGAPDAIEEGMILHDAGRVQHGEFDDVGACVRE